MIIKLAVLDRNRSYTDRLADIYRKKYIDRLELFCFSDIDLLCSALTRNRYDVILLDETLAQERKKLPPDSVVALLTNDPYQEKLGIPAICRFQRMEQLYHEVLALYAENNTEAVKYASLTSGGTKTVVVTGISGGAGASSVAAALSVALARQNRRVIYLNLEPLGSSEFYFTGEGKYSFSDLLYAVKSNRPNLQLRIESMIRYGTDKVGFFAAYANPTEWAEMTCEDFELLITILRQRADNDIIILDVPFAFGGLSWKAMCIANQILLVCGGDNTSFGKLRRLREGLNAAEPKDLVRRMAILGNRGAVIPDDCGIAVLGSLPHYAGAQDSRVLVNAMSQHELLQTYGEQG